MTFHPNGQHEVRVYSELTRGSGVCDEVFYIDCDPRTFARRLLLLDEMQEEGCGYTRAEVYMEHASGTRIFTVRTRRRQREKARTWGAWRRGVFGASRRDMLLARAILYVRKS